jgi:hypothetical protein
MTATLVAIVVVALAAYRVARAISVDTISDRPRGWVYERAFRVPALEPIETTTWDDEVLVARGIIPAPEERVAPAVQTISQPWAYVYGLLSCPFCSGFWVSLAGWVVYAGWHPSRQWFVHAVAAAGAQAIFAARGT